MSQLESIKSFLEPRKLAMSGVSRNPKKFGRQAYDHLKANGFTVYPVNPNTEEIDGDKCYKSLADLPADVTNLFVVTRKKETAGTIKDALGRGIKNIWIQQGSDTPEALEIAQKDGVNLITKKCIFMYAEPVEGVHKFHRFLSKLFGAYNK